jgi:hypothetical protein
VLAEVMHYSFKKQSHMSQETVDSETHLTTVFSHILTRLIQMFSQSERQLLWTLF